MDKVRYLRYFDTDVSFTDHEGDDLDGVASLELCFEYDPATKETTLVGADGRVLSDRFYDKSKMANGQ